MSEEEIENETQTLGALLRDARKSKNLALDDVREVTKISMPILKAMETDAYDSMPAVAFSRGFYVIYADFLGLDSDKVLLRYLEAKGLSHTHKTDYSVPPISKSGQFSNYAEPSSISPRSSATILFLICFAAIVGALLYLNWNPISYISDKLVPTQQTTPSPSPQNVIMQAVEMPPVTTVHDTIASEDVGIQAGERPPVIAVEDTIAQEEGAAQSSSYHVAINFHSKGTLTVTLDNATYTDKQYGEGDTLEWDVENSIKLDMPEEIDASIQLDGKELPLPTPTNGRRLLSLPEDILN